MRSPRTQSARLVSRVTLALVFALGGCAAEGPAAQSSRAASVATPLPAGARVLAALGEAQLVALRTIDEAPLGGDGPSALAVGIARAGRVQPVELPSPAVDAVSWGDAAAVRSLDGTLRRVTADGRFVLVARDVVDRPAVDDAGVALAIVVRDGVQSVALHRLEGGRTTTLARNLPAAGALRFSPDARHLVYVGRSPGGVAGLHVVAVPALLVSASNPSHPAQQAMPRCLTNCTLVTGALAENPFLALPAGPSELRFERDVIHYRDVRVTYRGAGE